MLRFLGDRPHALELAYRGSVRLLTPFRRWLTPGGFLERIFIWTERLTKVPVFDCRMCGQCVLHRTGMICPMACPKELRNGPCGGVRADGRCEILPDRPCAWTLAWERSLRMPVYGSQFLQVLPPVNHHLTGTSAWINELTGIARKAPPGWE